MKGSIIVAALWCATVSTPGHAQGMQAQCGAEIGKGLTTDPNLADGPDGWYADKTTDGETVIRIDAKSEGVEVRFKDARKIWLDVEDEGGLTKLVNLLDDPPSFLVLIVYPAGVVETLAVSGSKGARATLIHTVTRNLPFVTSSRTMSAQCVISFY